MDNLVICRLCLNLTKDYNSLLTHNRRYFVEILTSIEISDNDDLPKYACLDCCKMLLKSVEFQANILQNNRKLTENSTSFHVLNVPDLKKRSALINEYVPSGKATETTIENKSSTKDKTDSTNNVPLEEATFSLEKTTQVPDAPDHNENVVCKAEDDIEIEYHPLIVKTPAFSDEETISCTSFDCYDEAVCFSPVPIAYYSDDEDTLSCTSDLEIVNEEVTQKDMDNARELCFQFLSQRLLASELRPELLSCNMCDFKCKDCECLEKHKITHHKSSFACHECGFEFETQLLLEKHSCLHTKKTLLIVANKIF